MNDSPKRLYRSEHDRQIAGVCGGLAEYFNIDSSLVRLVFLLLFIFGGNGLLIYLLLWWIMPDEQDIRHARKRKNDEMFS